MHKKESIPSYVKLYAEDNDYVPDIQGLPQGAMGEEFHP